MSADQQPRRAGRPSGSVTAAEDQTRPRSVRLNDARWAKYKQLGTGWLEQQIDDAVVPEVQTSAI